MRAAVSSRGRVTIPKALRTQLGIRAGTVLDFQVRNGSLVAHKAAATDAVDSAWGILSLQESVDKFIDRSRGGRR
jgi:AbrB family looped-hinge helix DNA binding protein